MTGFALLVALALGPARADVFEDTRAVLALGPRVAGTAGGDRAQAWAHEQLAATGLRTHRVGAGTGAGAVLACTGEPDGAGWLLAHTDAVNAACPGAVDNAAGVAVALGIARSLAADPPEQALCVVLPDGEEAGLRGSRALALVHRPAWVMALELIGQGEPTAMGLGPQWGTAGLSWLSREGLRIPWAYRVHSRLLPDGERSDHGPFSARGVPGLLVLGRGPSGIYWPYHTAADDLSQVDPAALAHIAALIERLLRQGPPDLIPDAAVQVPWTRRVLPGRGVQILTALGAVAGVVAGRRGLGAALRGLAVAVGCAGIGGLAWLAALHGRPGDAALAGPGLLAWALAALAALQWVPFRPGAHRGGALLAGGLACALWPVDVLLSLPCGLAAAGLALAGRWPFAAVLALPLPVYLTWPSHWRELVFHGLLPASPVPWLLVLAVLWTPVVCAWQGQPRRLWGRALAGLAVLATAWAALQPAWTAAWPLREVLWPR